MRRFIISSSREICGGGDGIEDGRDYWEMGFDSIDLIIGDDRRSVESSRQREQTRSAVPRAPKGTQPALPHRIGIEPSISPPKEKIPTARQSNSPSYEQWVQGSSQQQQEIIRTTIIIIVTHDFIRVIAGPTPTKPLFPAEKRGQHYSSQPHSPRQPVLFSSL
jgi:hypothetical protein